MSKEKLFTIEDLERAWNDGFNKTHSEWKSFKVEIVMEKVAQTLQNGLDLILEDTKKSEYEKFKEDVKGCTGPK